MEEYPTNVMEFEKQFATEEACIRYLATSDSRMVFGDLAAVMLRLG
jgi:hypothetical protein